MFKTKIFLSFNSVKSSTRKDRLFLDELVKTRNITNASFVCFSIFDFSAETPNRLNFVTYPMEWISHLMTHFYGETELLFDTDFRKESFCDWNNLEQKSNAAKLFENIRAFGLGRNGISLAHSLGSDRYGVLSLSFHTRDRDWPIQKAYHLNAYQGQARRVALRYEAIYRRDTPDRYPITPREMQCLTWVALGMTDAQIARELGVTKWTVVSHLCNARRKLNCPNRAAAVAVALSRGIISLQA